MQNLQDFIGKMIYKCGTNISIVVQHMTTKTQELLFAALNCLERAKVEIDKEIDAVAKVYGESLGPKRKKQYIARFQGRIKRDHKD